eukprot:TRINITY_DN50807_c0_g1_i1.p1 TRINITY_DN50807_c0_g1~~TRINITY_DN50807_c0_g1_i1.p1  ORF type:complete len:737 (+),score=142.25 TRINITY_DN50807_c0_g1_i1:163-2373(+)
MGCIGSSDGRKQSDIGGRFKDVHGVPSPTSDFGDSASRRSSSFGRRSSARRMLGESQQSERRTQRGEPPPAVQVGGSEDDRDDFGLFAPQCDSPESPAVVTSGSKPRTVHSKKDVLDAAEQLVRDRPRSLDAVEPDDVFFVIATCVWELLGCWEEHHFWTPQKLRQIADTTYKQVVEDIGAGVPVPHNMLYERAVQVAAAEAGSCEERMLAGGTPTSSPTSTGAARPPPPQVACALDQGHRKYMEDFLFACKAPTCLFSSEGARASQAEEVLIAVYDGHAGVAAAEWLRERLHGIVVRRDEYHTDTAEALRAAFLQADVRFYDLARKGGCDAGSCVAFLLLREGVLWCANVGDCVAYLCRSDTGASEASDAGVPAPGAFSVVPLCTEHGLEDSGERRAVESRGGHVLWNEGCLRVNGMLQVTRTIGDRRLHSVLSQTPDVSRVELDRAADEFAVCGSDGLIATLTGEDICEFVRTAKNEVDSIFRTRRLLLRAFGGQRHARLLSRREGALPCNPLHAPGSQRKTETCARSQQSRNSDLHTALSAWHSSGAGTSQSSKRTSPHAWSCFSVPAGGCLWADAGAVTPDEPGVTQAAASLRRLRRAFQRQASIQRRLHQIKPSPLAVQQWHACSDPAELPEGASAEGQAMDDWLSVTQDAFHPDLDFHDYQVIAEALIGQCLKNQPGGCDNVSCAILFFHPETLSSHENEQLLALAQAVRQPAEGAGLHPAGAGTHAPAG